MAKKPDPFHYHEALHTTYVLQCTFHDHVVEHIAVEDDPGLTELALKVDQAMADLYQAIGRKRVE